MPKRSSKEPKDINQLAFRIVEDLTSNEPPEEEEQKNPHAVALGVWQRSSSLAENIKANPNSLNGTSR